MKLTMSDDLPLDDEQLGDLPCLDVPDGGQQPDLINSGASSLVSAAGVGLNWLAVQFMYTA